MRISRLRDNQLQFPPPPPSVVRRSNGPLSSSYQAYHQALTYCNSPISAKDQTAQPASRHPSDWHIDHWYGTWRLASECEQQALASSRTLYLRISAIGGAPVVSKPPSVPEPANKNRCCGDVNMPAVVVVGPPMLRQTSYPL